VARPAGKRKYSLVLQPAVRLALREQARFPARLRGPISMLPPSQFTRFDVRALIRGGAEPFPLIRQRVDALGADEGLIVVAPFLPSPLIEQLASEGLKSRVEHGPGSDWTVYFWRETD
jgi:hypothetical protein